MAWTPDFRFLTVRQKVGAMIVMMSALLLTILIVLLGTQLLRWTDAQEQLQFSDQTQAILGDLLGQRQQLAAIADDWSIWAGGPQALSQPGPDLLGRLNLNLIASQVGGQWRAVRWQAGDRHLATLPPFWPQVEAALRLDRLDPAEHLDAATTVPAGLLLISLRPISGQPAGRLVMGRLITLATPRDRHFQAELDLAPPGSQQGIFTLGAAQIHGHLLVSQQPAPPLLLDVHAPRRLHQQALWMIALLSVSLLGAAGLFVWGGLRIFDQLLLGRLRRIQASVNTIEAQGSVSPITIQGHDELDTLALAFNGMLDRLNLARAEAAARQTVLRQVAEAQPLARIGAEVLSLLELQLGGWVSVELYTEGRRLRFQSQRYPAPVNTQMLALIGAGGEEYGLIRSGSAAPLDTLRSSAELMVLAAQQHRLHEQLRDQALLDPLTGLLGPWGLHEALERDMERGPLAALQLNLDRFKRLNDTVGMAAGDELLRWLAERLRLSLSGEMYAGRLFGDKFVVILPGVRSAAQAQAAAQTLLAELSGPVQLEEYRLQVSARVGLALWPEHASGAQELLRFTDLAMPQPDDQVRIGVFSPALRERVGEQLVLETDLRVALEQAELGGGDFRVAYQPQIDLATGQVVGTEALARWTHPQLGNITPDRFIVLAEESGLMLTLGDWVLRQACAQLAEWHAQGLKLGMAVNVSALQFTSGELPGQVERALRDAGLSAQYLTLEVTESLLMPGDSHAHAQLHALAALGVKLAIDDFGTGYSSLSYLSRMPIHTLKIDRSFVRDLQTSQGLSALTRTLVHLGEQLGLSVVAEGIETPEQAALLREWGCPLVQGFLYAPALRPEVLVEHCRRSGTDLPLAAKPS
jgi:diguanylate cyclase (GGDEF)-like protein